MVPKEVMEYFEAKLAKTSMDESGVAAVPHQGHAHTSANEFLSMLKVSMSPGGGGVASSQSLHRTPEGDVMGLTENYSATFLSSGNACLDFFFQVVPSTTGKKVEWMLERAWAENALTTLKLAFHLRGVRGTGKSDREGFYFAALWLHKRHPATLRHNLESVAEFGYFKDLLEVLLRLVEGPKETASKAILKENRKRRMENGKRKAATWKRFKLLKQELEEKRKVESGKSTSGEVKDDESNDEDEDFVFVEDVRKMMKRGSGYYSRKGQKARQASKAGTLRPREERIAESQAADQAAKRQATAARKERNLELARRVARLFTEDLAFQALYLTAARVFAARLTEDVKALAEGRVQEISLAGKWAPSLDGAYDRSTLLCYAIAAHMFPKEAHAEYADMDDRRYGDAVRERFRKGVLVPLRKALELPEVAMSARRWGDVNYRRVASVAMKRYTDIFLNRDEERFGAFLADVKAGRAKIAAGALFPHEIVAAAVAEEDEGSGQEVAELQWARMVADLRAKGTLSNSLAVCDVSGSMSGEPMNVCIALGLLLSELSEEPWKGHVITFSERPEIHLVEGASLKEKHSFTRGMDWGMNTDLQLVFDNILTMAQVHGLAPEKMIKRLFIFSDMEFDQASTAAWETDHEAVCRKFRDAGYGSPPQIVFWNLRDSSSVPVRKSQAGVALVSGFSKNLLKVFLEQDGNINPTFIMESAIQGEEYAKLKVVD